MSHYSASSFTQNWTHEKDEVNYNEPTNRGVDCISDVKTTQREWVSRYDVTESFKFKFSVKI